MEEIYQEDLYAPTLFTQKRAGCNSALDRVDVENNLRPQYMEYINLDAAGIYANIYGDNSFFHDSGLQTQDLQTMKLNAGHFGGVSSGANTISNCAMYEPKAHPRKKVTSYVEGQRQKAKGVGDPRTPWTHKGVSR